MTTEMSSCHYFQIRSKLLQIRSDKNYQIQKEPTFLTGVAVRKVSCSGSKRIWTGCSGPSNLQRLRGIWKGYEEMASNDEKFLVRVRNVFGRIRNIFLEREMTYFWNVFLERIFGMYF